MSYKLISRIGGGLGNQMFIYALGLKYANDIGANLLFDTTDYFVFKYLVPCGANARKFELYDFKGPRKYRIWTGQYFFLLIWIIGKKIGWKTFERIVNRLGFWWRHCENVFEATFKQKPEKYCKIYSSGINCDVSLLPPRELLKMEFMLAEPLTGVAYDLERKMLECESVSIHVRRTDYLTQPTSWELPFVYYERAIEQIKKKVKSPKWFLFSDDPEWCKKRFASLVQDFTVVAGNADKPSIDLYLMSRCKHHIIANSTFSWWGAYLTMDVSGITLCPDYWGPYIDKLPETFYPEWWQRIGC